MIHLKSFLLFFFFLCLNHPFLFAQDKTYPEFRNYDYVYKEHIKSVRFYQFDSETDYPVLSLHSPGHFILSFDDLEAYTKDFSYKIIHCDANWNPSEELDPLDYIDGYQENRFYDAQNSFSTKVPYTHYEIQLPNEDVKWTKSGNYLLKVYRDDDENDLIITRRFMIVDTKMKIVPELRRSATPPYATSHQELYFSIQHTGIKIGNPRQQIKTAVLQNGRWDNAILNLEPTYIKNEEIGYDNQGKLLFPGYKEFRPLDLRSFRYRTLQVEQLKEYQEGFELWLFEDKHRTYTSHVFTHDLNGKFLIESHDNRNGILEGEYGRINFSLKALSPYEGSVYVLGGFNDFQPKEAFKMKYNKNCLCYQLSSSLKNGFYDYFYGLVDSKNNSINIQKIEGSSFESENDYLFLVYYKEFGGLYDQLVAVQKLNTRPE
ncbi:type IX secretion system plug protein [Aureispira anguillae]|uniref:DUF5103 domain-containing protein n=1 Tax=Aureispira anguillae TaxID=2864201 RepID=A0A915YG91_9BACT|nr:DUF5103 domain-containing protein [Aureispira anguillae]BDS12436.1 DUF5103 domain-containing protein [Aureispira anguillae]